MRKRNLAFTSVPHEITLETLTAFYPKNQDKFTSSVMLYVVMSRPLPPCLLSRHFLRPLKAERTTISPLRAGKARQFQVVGG